MANPNFYIQSSTTTTSSLSLRASSPSSDDEDPSSLPFPAPIPRSAFQTETFSPSTFLTTLTHRHQSLQDLRADLLSLLQSLQTELKDVLNENYISFLKMGEELKGGDELVEGVRVGVLEVRGKVEGVKKTVEERREMIRMLVEERKALRKQEELGRRLLDVETRIERLERSVFVKSELDGQKVVQDATVNADEDEDEDESDGESSVSTVSTTSATSVESPSASPVLSPSRLRRHILSYLIVLRLIDDVGADHTFIQAQRPRLSKIRQALLLDMGTALRQARDMKGDQSGKKIVTILGLYRQMNEINEGLGVLRS